MTFDTTRRYKTEFQEVDFHKHYKILTTSWLISPISGMIQNLGWTQVESTSKIIIIDVDNSSFGYDLTISNLVNGGHSPSYWRTP